MDVNGFIRGRKDDFVLELTDRINKSTRPRERLFLELIRDVGVRWREILDDGLNATPDIGQKQQTFVAEYILLSEALIAWFVCQIWKDFIPPEHVELAFDQFIDETKTRILTTWRELQEALKTQETENHAAPTQPGSDLARATLRSLSDWATHNNDSSS